MDSIDSRLFVAMQLRLSSEWDQYLSLTGDDDDDDDDGVD